MKTMIFDLPTFAFIIGTRAALACGIGLLLSNKLPAERRQTVGTALLILGAVTTIPAALAVVRSRRESRQRLASVGYDEGLIGATRFPRKGDDDVL